MMNDWIGLGFILLVVFGGLYLLTRPQKPVTQEEFEKRAAEGPSMLSAGAMGLQKILDPATGRAAAVQEDFRQGYLDGEQDSGDDDDKRLVRHSSDMSGQSSNASAQASSANGQSAEMDVQSSDVKGQSLNRHS